MRVWVTGGTGFVGSNVVAELLAAGDIVHGTLHRAAPPLGVDATWSRVDLLDPGVVRADVQAFAPDVVVHCAIRNDLGNLSADRRGAWRDYVDASRNVVDAANAVDALVILVSTDWVFDGTRPHADEAEPPRPINTYGVLKLAQERVVAERAVRGAVARLSGVNGTHRFGRDLPRAQDVGFGYLVASMISALGAGEPFTVWESPTINEIAAPSLASDSARMIRRIGARGAEGIFHCCGGEAVSRRELALRACEVFDLDTALLRFGPPDRTAVPDEPVPHDTSLDATVTAHRLGITPPGVTDLLTRFRDEWATAQAGGIR